MKLLLIAVAATILASGTATAGERPALKDQKEKMDYAIGVNMIGNLRKQGIDPDLELTIRGMRDAASGGTLLLDDNELRKATKAYQAEMRKKVPKRQLTGEAAEKKKEGEAFLAANRIKEGVVTLESGLQYQIVKSGAGRLPTDGDTVEYSYRAKRIDGFEFDGSHHTGKPVAVKVSKAAIPAFREAFKLMPEGSTWRLFVPASLAYGERGLKTKVGPNEAVIFEVELVGIK